jgi:hypothetical protein
VSTKFFFFFFFLFTKLSTTKEKMVRNVQRSTSPSSFFGFSLFPFLENFNTQQLLTLDALTLFIAAMCVGAICAVVPWVVALRTASNLTENFILTTAEDGKTKQKSYIINPVSGKPFTKSEISRCCL